MAARFEASPMPYILRRHFFMERMRAAGLDFYLTDVQSLIVEAHLRQRDEATAEKLLRDWRTQRTRKTT